jgi:voltage-gated potassium channel
VAFKQLPVPARSQAAYDRFSAATDLPLTILAVVWLPVLVLPLVMHLPASVVRAFDLIDLGVWAAYAAEYLIRLYLVPARKRFVTGHLVDLAVVVLPVLRPLRALRLLRLFNLARAGVVLVNALTRVRDIVTHRGLHFVLMAATGIVVVGSGVELAFEQHAHGTNIHNFGESLWWAIVTVTTVGYGDNYPVTSGGRCVAVVLMLVGIGLIGALTATVASYFVEEQADQDKAELGRRLDRIEEMLAQALARPDKSGLMAVLRGAAARFPLGDRPR